MKTFGISVLLIFSLSAKAQVDDLDKERAEHIQKLKDYQEKNPGWDSAPSDEYVSYFKKWNEESLAITLEYHKKKCEADSSQCLSKKQERDLRSQYKIASDTIERQNTMAKNSSGQLVTKPGEFGGDRAPAKDEVTPPATPPVVPPTAPPVTSPKAEETEDKTPDSHEKDDNQIGKEIPPVEKPEEKVEEENKEELDKFNDEEFPKNYDPKTCEWVEDMPRKIVYGPSFCSRQAVQICTGYVVCDRKQGGGKFIRMSSCSPKNCDRSKESAIACTLEQAYYSRRPEDERNHFVSPELKKVLTTPKVRAQ